MDREANGVLEPLFMPFIVIGDLAKPSCASVSLDNFHAMEMAGIGMAR